MTDVPVMLPVSQWMPLPPRARLLFQVSWSCWPLLGLIPAGIVWLATGGDPAWVSLLIASLSLLAFLVLWYRGTKAHARFRWKVDDRGINVRRGNWWSSESSMPIQRVQHLKVSRGPWQRKRQLATLKIFTAGTQNSSVTLPNMDADTAESIRLWLSDRIESVDE